jgi:DNA-binding NarL/FixJ family response regulator
MTLQTAAPPQETLYRIPCLNGQAVTVPRRSDTFIGRSAELGKLETALRHVIDGEHALAVVSGESGIGKSNLLDQFADRARAQDALVLRSWCAPVAGAGVAFGPVATLLREVLRQAPETAEIVRDLVPDAAYLVPEHLPRAASSGLSGELAQLRLLEAMRAVLAETARNRPVVAIIEDVQWADRSSADALAYLTNRSQPPSLMVVVSYRSEDLRRHHFMHPIVTEMERAPHAERISLEPFGTREIRRQTTGLIGTEPTEDLVRELADRSGGNPFFVSELVAASMGGLPLRLPASVPSTLSDLLTARFDHLPAEHRRLLRIAAAVGSEIHPELLAAAMSTDAETDDGTVLEALRAAVEAGVLALSGDRLAFRHELLREAVYAGLLPSERRKVHGCIARSLAASPELAPEGWATGELAFHWQEAGEPELALAAAITASAEAREVGALAAAARHGARVLELWDEVPDPDEVAGTDRVQVLMDLAADSGLAGKTAAQGWAERALELVDPKDEPARYADIAARLASYELTAGDPEAALRTIAVASDLIEPLPVSSAKARVAVQHAQILMNCDLLPTCRERAQTAWDLAAATGDKAVEVQARGIYGLALCTLGSWRKGLDVLAENQKFAEQLGTDEGGIEARARAALARAFCLYWLGFPDLAYEVAEAGHLEASKHGLSLSLGTVLRSCASTMALTAGKIEAATVLLHDISPPPLARHAWFLSEARCALALANGDTAAADRALSAAALSRIAPIGLYHLGPYEIALAAGDLDTARSIIDEQLSDAIRLDLTWKVAPLVASGLLAEIEMLVQSQLNGDESAVAEIRDRAADLSSKLTQMNERLVAVEGVLPPSVETWTAVGSARLAEVRDAGDPDLWRAAITTSESSGMRLVGARSRLALARCQLSEGDRDAAAQTLRELLVVTDELGLSAVSASGRDLADRARIRLGESPSEGADTRSTPVRLGITDRELQVLQLVAEGLTNREIGETLFLSPKTVSVHVTNLLRKLDVPSRREAARLARKLGVL